MQKALILIVFIIVSLSIALLTQESNPETLKLSHKIAEEFKQWSSEHNKIYSSPEAESYRFEIFVNNYLKIIEHNNKGLTQFADITQDEFTSIYLGLKVDEKKINRKFKQVPSNKKTAVNWVTKGVVAPVKNQGKCGSCWAFSTAADLESVNAINTGNLVLYSEQQLVDCSRGFGNQGCEGGLMDFGFIYVIENGIETEDVYPYTAKDDKCVYDRSLAQFPIQTFSDVRSGDCDSLSDYLVLQPISVGVDASNWRLYKGGVMKDCSDELNHGVLLVGETNDYWLIKNSWGTTWGEQGFIRLSTGNTCGICLTAVTGSLKR